MSQTLYAVVRPDGEMIDCEPGINLSDALWLAREHDERLHRIIQPNRTSNVSGARKAGYSFHEVVRATILR